MIKKILACMIPVMGFCFDHIPPEVVYREDPSFLYKLRGILLLGDWNSVRNDPMIEVNGVQTNDVQLLNENPGFLAALQKQYVGQQLRESTIEVIQKAISDFYESNNQPLVIVNVPQQNLANGVLQLVVTETVLGEIRCKGNNYFLSDQLKKHIRAKPGKPISTDELLKDLAFMNHNPFRRTDAIFSPGVTAGVADLELVTIDRWPYRVYVGADNTGTISTERNRLFFGVNLGKTIIEDSEVSYQYTTAPNGNRFYSHTGMVRVPLPWMRHVFQAFGGYANVELERISSWKSRGVSWDVGLRYRIPMFNGLGMLQEIVMGYDFKETGTHVKQSGEAQTEGQADISQFMVGYNLGVRNRHRKITLNMEFFASPSHMTHQNNEVSFEKLRSDSDPQYVYAKLVQSLLQEISGGWRFSYNISGQIASASLLPSEQMTMTGYNGVRGFEERILNLDNAALVNLTFEAPHISPAYWLGWKKHYDDLSVLVFFDSGIGRDHHIDEGKSNFQSLGSIGPSIRYELSRYISTHLDYGFQLWHNGFSAKTDSRYNFGFTASF